VHWARIVVYRRKCGEKVSCDLNHTLKASSWLAEYTKSDAPLAKRTVIEEADYFEYTTDHPFDSIYDFTNA
jgi:hypothetical protein